MSLSVGDRYIDFTLVDSQKESHTLSNIVGKGPVVLAFYPGAFTGVCDKEVCSLRDGMARYNELGATVLGISVDGPFALKEFAAKYQLNFPILSDFTRAVTRSYDLIFNNLGGVQGYDVANRAVYVLDNDGVVRYAWVASPSPGVEPNYDEVITAVSALKA